MKQSVIKLVVGAAVVLLMMGTAPLVVGLILMLGDDTPSVEEVCAHLRGDLGVSLSAEACAANVEGRAASLSDDVRAQLLLCLGDAADAEELKQCDDAAYVFSYTRERREQERAGNP